MCDERGVATVCTVTDDASGSGGIGRCTPPDLHRGAPPADDTGVSISSTLRELAAFAVLAALVCGVLGSAVLCASLVGGPLRVVAALGGATLAAELLRRPVGRAVDALVAPL